MTATKILSDETPGELRQWWYGKDSVVEYISSVAFKGPFRDLVSENSANYQSLRWSELPGTTGRYRAALSRTEVMNSADDLCLRVYLEQRYNQGNSPTPQGVDGSVEIVGQSSLAGDITEKNASEAWKFSQTGVNGSGYYYSQRYYSGAQTIPLSKVYGSASRDISVTLTLTFYIKEPVRATSDVAKFPLNILIALAENLTSQGNCDVGFATEDGVLYAMTPILKARSEYFVKMFAFDQDTQSEQDGATSDPYQQKDTKEPFDLLHTIFYYLYTDRIVFSTNLNATLPTNLPKLCPAEDIYEAADRMLLNDLKEKALTFLKISCTTENITSRVLSDFADVHAEVGTVYADYFRKNWDRVKESESFDQAFEDLEEGSNERKNAEKRFRDVMKRAVFL